MLSSIVDAAELGMDRSRAKECLDTMECYVRGPVIPNVRLLHGSEQETNA
jgi:hypothetical protein